MYCAKCSRHIAYCKCEDIDERLSALKDNSATQLLSVSAKVERQSVSIDSNIEFILSNLGKQIKVFFRSNKHNGTYYLIGNVTDVNPEYTMFNPALETNYPSGIFNMLNTSRITGAELAIPRVSVL
jgi:hypothetical protein